MVSPIQCTRLWVKSGSQWMDRESWRAAKIHGGSQTVGHDGVTGTELEYRDPEKVRHGLTTDHGSEL